MLSRVENSWTTSERDEALESVVGRHANANPLHKLLGYGWIYADVVDDCNFGWGLIRFEPQAREGVYVSNGLPRLVLDIVVIRL